MNFNFSKVFAERRWRNWLHEPVYFENRIVERFKAYRVFVITGLIPFVKRHGYSWVNETEIPNHLANLIYQKKEWIFQDEARNEDYDYYIVRRIPQDDWDEFWERWGYFVDFSEDNLRNRFQVCPFVWNRLDLMNSPATEDLEWELGEEGPEDGLMLNDLTFVKDKHSLY
jgi:hypothetical protein